MSDREILVAMFWREIRKKMWHCSECNTEYTKQSKICEYCGHEINAEDLEKVLDWGVTKMREIMEQDSETNIEDYPDDFIRQLILRELAKISLEED